MGATRLAWQNRGMARRGTSTSRARARRRVVLIGLGAGLGVGVAVAVGRGRSRPPVLPLEDIDRAAHSPDLDGTEHTIMSMDGGELAVGGTHLRVLHTPGHSPGGCSLHEPDEGVLFSGDTLFEGGPGATGRSFSDRATLVRSIADRLLPLPAGTLVHTGHGDDTTIGDEAPGILAELDA